MHEQQEAETTPQRVRPPLLDSQEAETTSELFSLLSSPVRVSILCLLAESDRRVNELVACLDMSQPRVSQHLRILRNHHVVRAQRKGREVVYSLTDQHLADLIHSASAHLESARGSAE